MNIYAIGDLHLSLKTPKEMDIFGPHWKNHFGKISADWNARVKPEDVVLIPGDISWAMTLEDAQPDLDAICALPGKKVLLKGNHDYWWGSLRQVREALTGECYALQNDCIVFGDYVVCGTRGWIFPQDSAFSAHDTKIFEREKMRLRMSLDAAKKYEDKRLIVMMHYPPLYETATDTDFVRILHEYGPQEVVFGHLHGNILRQIHLRDFKLENINFNLASADYLDFKLLKVV